ncbi:glycosyltransferase [Prolixibacteraceae bacterium JC049]|nr:glycosyltransferase [Prolixibacteraceae bacterium JC049]
MKILMLLESDFPPDIRVENEVEQLKALGHEVTVACYTFGNRPEFEELPFCNVIRKTVSKFIHKTSVGCLKFPFYFNFWRRFARSILKKEHFDALHVHDLPLASVGVDLKEEFGIPLIVDLHENWPALIKDAKHTNTFLGKLLSSNRQWEEYEATVLKEADRLITVVEEMKMRIAAHGVLEDRIFVLSNVMNLRTFPELETTAVKNKMLFYAGGLNKHRGLQIAIRGLQIALKDRPELELNIVGFGSYEEELKELTRSLKLEDKVHFLGRKTQSETYDEMLKADIMLIPHLRSVQTDNSSPNKLYQYMYAAKPILTSDCQSLKRIVLTEKVGFCYVAEEAEDFARQLKLLITANSENELGLNGREAVVHQYNWERQRRELNELYESLELS